MVLKAKVMSVVGVRPNFVKLAALHEFLEKDYDHVVVHTGQHYDYELSKAFFECLELPEPDYNLEVGSGTHGYQLGEMIKRTEKVLLKEKPNLVIVYGDANSTLAGALAAVKLHIKTAHVEAGYRSFDKKMPEEINRLLTDAISDLLFAPTKTAEKNLKKENVQGKICLTGDVMVDVLLKYMKTAEKKSKILKKLNLKPKEYITVTFHREENTENKTKAQNIVKALLKLKNYKFVFPIHPRTKKALKKYKLLKKLEKAENIKVIPPLNYLDFVKLEKNSLKIITDSGGVQKEAYILGIPCITLRSTTEMPETVKEGWNKLVDTSTQKIIEVTKSFNSKNNKPRKALGNGKAAEKIKKIINNHIISRLKPSNAVGG